MFTGQSRWLIITICFLLSGPKAFGQSDAAGTYRHSWFFENEVLYVGDQLALWRNATATEEGESRVLYSLTRAHWLNQPDFSDQTGDTCDTRAIVDDVRALAWLPAKKLLIGKGRSNSDEDRLLLYFLAKTDTKEVTFYRGKGELRLALFPYYSSEEEMLDALATAGSRDFQLQASELYFRRMVQDTLDKQAKKAAAP